MSQITRNIFLTKNEQIFETISTFLKGATLQADCPKTARGWFIFRDTTPPLPPGGELKTMGKFKTDPSKLILLASLPACPTA